jgi:zinc transport system substrate-binding protein
MIMSKNFKYGLLFIGAFFLALVPIVILIFANNESDNDGELKAAASIFPITDIASNVAGEEVEVITILPSGASPHTYEPTAAQQAELSDVDVLFVVGAEFDDWAVETATAANPDIEVVDLSQVVNLKEYGDEHSHDHEHEDEEHDDHEHEDGDHEDKHDDHEHADDDKHEDDKHEKAHESDGDKHAGEENDDSHGKEEEDHGHGEYDPHYWLDVENAILIAEEVESKFIESDEENEEDYSDNLREYKQELEQLDSELTAQLEQLGNTGIITFHGAFNYFADAYGLEVVAVIEEFPGSTPSAAYIAEVGEVIESENVRVLFKEPQLSEEIVTALAIDYDATVETLDPLGGGDELDSYIELMRYNAETVEAALD